MALPVGYNTYDEYFTAALSFLKDHEYLFNFANTDILLDDILKNVSTKWRGHLEIVKNNKTIENERKTQPSVCDKSKQYEKFYEKLRKLLPSMSVLEYDSVESVKQKPLKGLSPKKQHEIFKLSKVIHEHCQQKNITLIVDLGSGLGYLSQLMYEKHGYSVLGIESDEIRLSSALKRQEKYHKSSAENVKYVRHFVTAQSENTLMELVKENFDKCESFCLVGLHACADLAVNAIKLFLKIEKCKSLIIMPCCYHKMAFIAAEEKDELLQENLTINCHDISCSNKQMNSSKHLKDNRQSSNYLTGENIIVKCMVSTNEATLEKYSNTEYSVSQNITENQLLEKKFNTLLKNPGNIDGFLFENFPMSLSLKSCCRKTNATILLRRPFLRLACQRVEAGWKETEDKGKAGARVFHLMSRAVLQLYAIKENAKLVKTKRRAVRKIQSKKCDVESFLDDAINRGYVLELNSEEKYKNNHLNNVSKSFTNVSTQFNDSSTSKLNNEYCKENNASSNCTDSIVKNKNPVSRHGTEEEEQNEQSKRIQQENVTGGKPNEARSMFECIEKHKLDNNDVSFTDNNTFLEFDKRKILALWDDLCDADFNAAAVLLELQDSLQALCENLVLLDKIAFLHERNVTIGDLHFEFIKVTNDSLSPRCHALVATK